MYSAMDAVLRMKHKQKDPKYTEAKYTKISEALKRAFTMRSLYQRIRDGIVVWAVMHLVLYAVAEVASHNIAVDLLQYLILP